MQTIDLIQKFEAFLQHPNVQERGELEVAYYLGWYLVKRVSDKHEHNSIIPALPRYIAGAMKYLRESNDPQISKFRQTYLAARGQQEIPDLTAKSLDYCINEVLPTVSMIGRLMRKVTGDNTVEDSIKAPYLQHIQLVIATENDLRTVLRKYLIAEVEAVRQHCVIVKRSLWGYYYQAFPLWPDRNGNPPEAPYLLSYYAHDKPSFRCQLGDDNRPDNVFNISGRSYPFHSWEDVANWDCSGLHSAWFRVEQTLSNRNWWQQHRSPVLCQNEKDFYNPKIENLDVWTPQPGIERTWYTDAMLAAELSMRLDDYVHGSHPIFGQWVKRPIADEYLKVMMAFHELKKGF